LLLAKKEDALQGMNVGMAWQLFAERHRDFDDLLEKLLEADSDIRT
jgi:hypothetical protein